MRALVTILYEDTSKENEKENVDVCVFILKSLSRSAEKGSFGIYFFSFLHYIISIIFFIVTHTPKR